MPAKKKRAVPSAIATETVSKGNFVNLNEAPVIYTNVAEVGGSIFDIRLRLGQVLESSDQEGVSIREVAMVVMSPQHAKSLLGLLMQRIKAYEDFIGTIPGVEGVEVIHEASDKLADE